MTTRGQTSILTGGEVRESGLTGVTRNHVSLTGPGVRIPPSPPPSPRFSALSGETHEIRACARVPERGGYRRGPRYVAVRADSADFSPQRGDPGPPSPMPARKPSHFAIQSLSSLILWPPHRSARPDQVGSSKSCKSGRHNKFLDDKKSRRQLFAIIAIGGACAGVSTGFSPLSSARHRPRSRSSPQKRQTDSGVAKLPQARPRSPQAECQTTALLRSRWKRPNPGWMRHRA